MAKAEDIKADIYNVLSVHPFINDLPKYNSLLEVSTDVPMSCLSIDLDKDKLIGQCNGGLVGKFERGGVLIYYLPPDTEPKQIMPMLDDFMETARDTLLLAAIDKATINFEHIYEFKYDDGKPVPWSVKVATGEVNLLAHRMIISFTVKYEANLL
jgi:hypothetical protein